MRIPKLGNVTFTSQGGNMWSVTGTLDLFDDAEEHALGAVLKRGKDQFAAFYLDGDSLVEVPATYETKKDVGRDFLLRKLCEISLFRSNPGITPEEEWESILGEWEQTAYDSAGDFPIASYIEAMESDPTTMTTIRRMIFRSTEASAGGAASSPHISAAVYAGIDRAYKEAKAGTRNPDFPRHYSNPEATIPERLAALGFTVPPSSGYFLPGWKKKDGFFVADIHYDADHGSDQQKAEPPSYGHDYVRYAASGPWQLTLRGYLGDVVSGLEEAHRQGLDPYRFPAFEMVKMFVDRGLAAMRNPGY